MTNNSLINKAKEYFLNHIHDFGSDPFCLIQHVNEAEKWAKYLLNRNPNIDRTVIKLTVWLHDIGHYPIRKDSDHSIKSMQIAHEFLLKNDCPTQILENTLNCIRTHRNKDKIPESEEAKLFIIIDSVSHMTDTIYLDMIRDDKTNKTPFRALKKLKRDIKDLATDNELYNELKPVTEAWENLIKAIEQIHI